MRESINWLDEVLQIKNELLQDLMTLLKIDSVKDLTTKTAEAPFGKAVKEALDTILMLGARDNFLTKEVEHVAGHIEFGSGKDILGILGHVDVVPINEGWTKNPFVPVIENDRIYARGILDDKGPLLAAYYGMKLVREKLPNPSKRIRLIVGTDEESGWECIKTYLKHEESPNLGFSPDAFFPVVNGEKGVMTLELSFSNNQQVKSKNKIISLTSGLRDNMIPEKAEAIVEVENRDLFESTLAQYAKKHNVTYSLVMLNSNNRIKLVVKGKGAHSMAPEQGENALVYLISFLYELNVFSSHDSLITFCHQNFQGDWSGEKLNIAVSDTKMGDLTIAPTILEVEEDGIAKLILNIRYPKNITQATIIDTLKNYEDDYSFSTKMLNNQNPHHVPEEEELVQILLNVYNKQMGTKEKAISIGGTTFGRAIPNGVSYGALFPHSENTMHQADEHMLLTDLLLTCSIYAEAIYELSIITDENRVS